jgi:hypothetical protein
VHSGTARKHPGRPGATNATQPEIVVNDAESPLAWLAGRKGPDGKPLLSQAMFDAGERLRRDYETARMGSRITACWDAAAQPLNKRCGPGPDARLSHSERVVAARQRVWRALEAAGPGLSSILLEVCCLASGLETAERHLKWPKRSAKLVLVLALDRLAAHYGYDRGAQGGRGGRITSWGLTDFRPDLLGHLEEDRA